MDLRSSTKSDSSYSEMSSSELVRHCLANDSGAWEEILNRHKKRIFNISYQFVGRMDEAEDLTQEILFKIFHSLDKFNPEANFNHWVIRVSKNYCIDYYRKKRKERESVVDDIEKLTNLRGTFSTPHMVLEEKEKLRNIRDSINSLPTILRSCIVLRNLYGYSYQDIARILGIPEGTVKSRINRGRHELSKFLRLSSREPNKSEQEITKVAKDLDED